MHTAYLVATFTIQKGVPLFAGLGIYSESARSLTRDLSGREAKMDVASVRGDSYDAAVTELIRLVDNFPTYAWCRPYLKKERR